MLRVRRCWVFGREKTNPLRRITNVFLYCIALFREVLYLRPDVVTASTFPPVVAAWSASLAARIIGARFIYHIQDVHPEVSQYSGGRLGRGLSRRILIWLDDQTLRHSAKIVVLSDDMADTLRARGLSDLPIHVINNFLLDSYEDGAPPPADLRKPLGRRRVIFAGNMGRFQNLPLLIEGVAVLFDSHPELELFLLGDGTEVPGLKARWGNHPQVRFAPFMPFGQARDLIAEADVGLVSLSRDMYRVAYPSKMLTYLGLGVPVLTLVEPDSGMARTVRSAGLGAVPEAESPEAIADALARLLTQPVDRAALTAWHDATVSQPRAVARWKALVEGRI